MQPTSIARPAAVAALCLVSLLQRADGATRRALLVGIGDYQCVTASRLKLAGAANDLGEMHALLAYCGFRVQELLGSQASGTAIKRAMHALVSRAQSGDEVVFYFSGRGSVAPNPADPRASTDLEPTLVPHDGAAADARNDIRMGYLEQWAAQLKAKGAAVVIIVDACYTSPSARGEDRHYNPVPRCVLRHGQPRAELYKGPGVFLAAAGARGRAYEWDLSNQDWMGAFTSELTNRATAKLKKGQHPSYAELMQDVRTWFAAAKKCDYLPGELPYPDTTTAPDDYKRPLFAAAPSPSQEQQTGLAKKDDARKERERFLRVALDTPEGRLAPEDRAKLLEAVSAQMKIYLKSKGLKEILILPAGAARPDRYLYVERMGSGLKIRAAGNEVDASEEPHYEGGDVAAVMDHGLATYLLRKAYTLQLFRLADSAEKATLKNIEWSAGSERRAYDRREKTPFKYIVNSSTDGLIYVLEQDPDGIVQLAWPLAEAPDNRVSHDRRCELTTEGYYYGEDAAAGQRQARAFLVVPSENANLPSLQPPPGKQWIQTGADGKHAIDAAYWEAEKNHLHALLDAIESGRAKWAVVPFAYDVK